jgi:hypothetical protein
VQQTYVEMGVLDADEVRSQEGYGPRIRPAVPPPALPVAPYSDQPRMALPYE